MKRVAVAIVNHAKKLTANEIINMEQLYSVLKGYDVFWVVPESLEADYLDGRRIKRFQDSFFTNRKNNSKLMLDKTLYEALEEYEYVLFCQTDVFIFSDQLQEICEWGYDYIGAPTYEGLHLFFNGKAVINVFNGGLSLRNTKAFSNWIDKDYKRISFSLNYHLEDTIITEFGAEYMRMPDNDTAVKFSINSNVEYCLKKLNGELPFGCHGWERQAFDLWKPIIEKYGYKVTNQTENENRKWELNYNSQTIKKTLRKCLSSYNGHLCVWGMGENGCTLSDILGVTDDEVVYMDRDIEKVSSSRTDMRICPINEGIGLGWPIIISPYNNAFMCRELEDKGYILGKTYTTYDIVINKLKYCCLDGDDL